MTQSLDLVEVRTGAYHDSGSLMQVSRAVAATAGVSAAQVAMATELNVEVLTGMGFRVPDDANVFVSAREPSPRMCAGRSAARGVTACIRAGSGAGGHAADLVAARRGATCPISVPGAMP